MSYANPKLQDWHDERLAEIQSYERTARDHIEGISFRAETYPEPYRSEFHSVSVAMANLKHYVDQRFAFINNEQP